MQYVVITHTINDKIYLYNWYLLESSESKRWLNTDTKNQRVSVEIRDYPNYEVASREISKILKYCTN